MHCAYATDSCYRCCCNFILVLPRCHFRWNNFRSSIESFISFVFFDVRIPNLGMIFFLVPAGANNSSQLYSQCLHCHKRNSFFPFTFTMHIHWLYFILLNEYWWKWEALLHWKLIVGKKKKKWIKNYNMPKVSWIYNWLWIMHSAFFTLFYFFLFFIFICSIF